MSALSLEKPIILNDGWPRHVHIIASSSQNFSNSTTAWNLINLSKAINENPNLPLADAFRARRKLYPNIDGLQDTIYTPSHIAQSKKKVSNTNFPNTSDHLERPSKLSSNMVWNPLEKNNNRVILLIQGDPKGETDLISEYNIANQKIAVNEIAEIAKRFNVDPKNLYIPKDPSSLDEILGKMSKFSANNPNSEFLIIFNTHGSATTPSFSGLKRYALAFFNPQYQFKNIKTDEQKENLREGSMEGTLVLSKGFISGQLSEYKLKALTSKFLMRFRGGIVMINACKSGAFLGE
jgi:hypothetical protein